MCFIPQTVSLIFGRLTIDNKNFTSMYLDSSKKGNFKEIFLGEEMMNPSTLLTFQERTTVTERKNPNLLRTRRNNFKQIHFERNNYEQISRRTLNGDDKL